MTVIFAGRVFALPVLVDHDGPTRGIGRRFTARLNQIGGVIDHGGEIALTGAAEIPVRAVFGIGGILARAQVLRPLTAGTDLRDHFRIIDLDAGERRRRRPIVADINGISRHAGGGENGTDFAHRIGGGMIGRSAMWHIDDNAAGGLTPPKLRKR